jgi:RNA polymerase sigma-70 factor, ECF subfamily
LWCCSATGWRRRIAPRTPSFKAYRSWSSFKGDAPAEAWIHRIAINTAISHRRRQRLREVGELVRRFGRPQEPDPESLAVESDLLRELRRLPPRLAAVVVLRHLHGYSNREIAAALREPESTVATRLMTAKRSLRARLEPLLENRSDTPAALGVLSGE